MQLVLPQISQPLKIWEKIEIIIGDDDNKGIYQARIEDFVNDDIVITPPEFQEGKTLLRDDSPVVVLVTKKDAVYQFSSRIKKIKDKKNIAYLLSPPKDITRVQRRQFVRIDMFCHLRAAFIDSLDKDGKFKWFNASSVNISGGGMLLECVEKIKPSDIIVFTSDVFSKLNIAQPIAAICRRTYEEDKKYYSGVEFIRADHLSLHLEKKQIKLLPHSITLFDRFTQNQLINFIFHQQIEMRKKGLI